MRSFFSSKFLVASCVRCFDRVCFGAHQLGFRSVTPLDGIVGMALVGGLG